MSLEGSFRTERNPQTFGLNLSPAFFNAAGTYGPRGSANHNAWMGGLLELHARSARTGAEVGLSNSLPPVGSPLQNVTYFEGGFSFAAGGNQQVLLGRRGFGGESTVAGAVVSHYSLSSGIDLVVTPLAQTLTVVREIPAGPVVEGDSVRLRAISTDGRTVQVRMWTFTPDSAGSREQICVGAGQLCQFTGETSGLVTVQARLGVGGWIVEAQTRLEVTRAVLKVSADRWFAGVGRDVSFLASSPSGRPVSITSWIASSPGVRKVGCQPGDATCTWELSDSLWMVAIGTVNGRPKRDSARVAAVSCPTDDTVLDHPHMRKLLKQLDSLTKSTNPPLERAGQVIQLADGSFDFRLGPLIDGGSCTSSWPGFVPDPPERLVFFAHTHPYKIGQSTCEAGSFYTYGGAGIIASKDDWLRFKDPDRQVPQVVLDRTRVVRMNPIDSTRFTVPTKRINKDTGQEETILLPSKDEMVAASNQLNRTRNGCTFP